MQPNARHIHHEQQSRNGSFYNDNYSIPNSPALWRYRDSLWLYKNAMAVWQNGAMKAFCHKGSNATEFFHRNSQELFSYLSKEQVFLHRLPAITILQKFAHNLKRAKLIVNQRFEKAKRYDPENYHIHQQILMKLQSIAGIDCLRKEFMDTETGHGRLFFKNTNKKIDDFLYGFDWKQSVSRITRLTYNDKREIWKYIEKYKEQLIQQHGKITNDKSLEFLLHKLEYRCTAAKLKELIMKYWLIDDDLIDDAIDELQQCNDHDIFSFEEYNTSPAKNKKDSEYYIYIYIFTSSIFISSNFITF